MHASLVRSAKGAISIHAVKAADLKRWLAGRGKREAEWLKSAGFSAKEHEMILVPGAGGGFASVALGLGKGHDILALAQASESLPQGTYALGDVPEPFGGINAVLAWILGTYKFDRYKKIARFFRSWPRRRASMAMRPRASRRVCSWPAISSTRRRTTWGRMNLADAARALAKKHGAKISFVVGDDLLKKNYPLIHTVGPRLARGRHG